MNKNHRFPGRSTALASLAVALGMCQGWVQTSAAQTVEVRPVGPPGQRWIIRETTVTRRVGDRVYHETWTQRIPVAPGMTLGAPMYRAAAPSNEWYGDLPPPIAPPVVLKHPDRAPSPVRPAVPTAVRRGPRVITEDDSDEAPPPRHKFRAPAPPKNMEEDVPEPKVKVEPKVERKMEPRPERQEPPKLESKQEIPPPAETHAEKESSQIGSTLNEGPKPEEPLATERVEDAPPPPSIIDPNVSGDLGRQSLEVKREAWRRQAEKLATAGRGTPRQLSPELAPLPDSGDPGKAPLAQTEKPVSPAIAEEPPVKPAPVAAPPPAAATGHAKPDASHPIATLAGPGFVKSPYPPYHKLDVSGLSSGALAKDPATGQIFRVP